MLAETRPRTTISFYKCSLLLTKSHARALWIALTKLNVFGRIYGSWKGLTQISVPQNQVDALREFLCSFDPALQWAPHEYRSGR